MSVDVDAISNLIECCRDGRFYEDYDASMELLSEATAALDSLRNFAGAVDSTHPRV